MMVYEYGGHDLQDWRRHDGYVYAIYCGMRREGGGKGNGFNSIGIARSRDTLVWEVPNGAAAPAQSA